VLTGSSSRSSTSTNTFIADSAAIGSQGGAAGYLAATMAVEDASRTLVLELRRALAVLAADRVIRTSNRARASPCRRALAPAALHIALSAPFNSFDQQDAAEFLRCFLDAAESAKFAAPSCGTFAALFGGLQETRAVCLV
jgi:hypothetical protein